jgi:predicted permease
MDAFLKDIRYGLRSLRRRPGFTATALITLAIGIGANVALFSVVSGVLLNPLPYPNPDQLITLHQSKPSFDTGAIPYPNFRDWQSQNQTFASMAISRGSDFTLTGVGDAERVDALFVSGDYFKVLGIELAKGRDFAAGEDQKGAEPVVIVSAGFWNRKFGASNDLHQQSITLDDRSYGVIGVLPPSFNLRTTDVFVPIGQWNIPALENRGAGLGLHGIGRLKPGVTFEQAQADLNRVASNLAATYPDTNKANGAKLIPLRERLLGDVGPTLLTLLGAVGFVLLIACVNVSNLMLARSTGRTREFAIRAALGAGRGRLLRQLLTESTLLALAGGALGLLLAAWGTKAALAALPLAIPRASEVSLDTRVLIFTVIVSLLTGLLAGLAPALKTSEWRLANALKEGKRSAPNRSRLQSALVVVEMALALVLLVGAGLMVRSLAALWNVDPGFRSENTLTFGLSLPPSMGNASPEEVRSALRELNARLHATPGLEAAAFTDGTIPLQGENDRFFWRADQPRPASQSEMNLTLVYVVGSNYLQAMGIPLKRGRFFTEHDNERTPRVAVIDEQFAQKYFGSTDPIGKEITFDGDEKPLQIVGVVGHVKQWSLDTDDQSLQAQLYQSFSQFADDDMGSVASGFYVVARGSGNTQLTLDSMRQVVQSQNKQNVIYSAMTMNEIIGKTLAARQFSMILLASFAAMALVLSSIGLYGVISYLVGQRTHELGIRMALGAQRRDVLLLVMNNGMRMALIGVALGVVAATLLTRLMTKLLYGVSATDPATFVLIAVLLSTVALLACYLPARKATRVDPLIALRYE